MKDIRYYTLNIILKNMKRADLIPWVLVRIIPVFLCVFSLSCNNKVIDLDLSGEWDMYITDIENFDNAAFYLEKTKCSIPGDWAAILKKNPENMSFIRLEKEITIPGTLKNQPLILSLGRIALSDQTFFNGKEIGGTGYMPSTDNPLDYGFALKNYRKYHIPSALVNYGGKNIVTVQIFSHIYSGFPEKPFITTQQNWEQNYHLMDFYPVLQNFGIIVVNLILLCMIAYAIQKEKRFPFLFYPLFLFIISAYTHLLVMGAPSFGNGLLRYKLILILFIFGALFTYLILLSTMTKKKKKFFYIFLASLCVVLPVILYTPDTAFLISVSVPFFIGLMVLASIFICVPLSYRLFMYPLKHYYTLLLIIPFCVILWNTFYPVLTLNVYRMPVLSSLCVPVIFLNAFFFILDDNKSTSIRTGKGLFEFSRDVVKQNEKIKNREIIHSIIRYLDSNYTENYNRQELAEKFKIHDNYMVQLFKKHTGSSISGYINNLRIKASIKLMKNDDSKIVDIAYHVGYNNLTYFYRAFKSFTGMTPNEYRAEGNNCEDLQKKIDAKDS